MTAEAATPAEPLVEPRPTDWWEEDAATAARYDRSWFDRDED
jgi:hypothetical protein